MSSAILVQEKYIKDPAALAYIQGKVFGIRLVLEGFFNDVATEHQRRLDRDNAQSAPESRR
jgi:hypothetical protein